MGDEESLLDAMPAAGGTGYIDLRKAPALEEGDFDQPLQDDGGDGPVEPSPDEPGGEQAERRAGDEGDGVPERRGQPEPPRPSYLEGYGSSSSARAESQRDALRDCWSSDQTPLPEDTEDIYDPEIHDYHHNRR